MTLVTITEAAERAVVHPQTVRRWIREGRLRVFQPFDLRGLPYRDRFVYLSQVLEVERDRRRARHAKRGPYLRA